jgi:hypothetical protein
MLTPKENYLRLARGEMPEYVPNFTMGGIWPPNGKKTEYAPTMRGDPPIFPKPEKISDTETKDMWGIHRVANAETNWQSLPKPNYFILEDVTKWSSVVKKPEMPPLSSYDWEKVARDATAHINRETTGVQVGLGTGPFQFLINYMGFTEGLCALLEEPEAVAEMLNYMADFYMPYIEKFLDYVKPEFAYLTDDTAAQKDPFFSTGVFREIFLPIYRRFCKPAVDRGIHIMLHNCGRCEDWMEDYIDVGVKFWDPAQECNDLFTVKKKFKGRLVVVGGYNLIPGAKYNDMSEEYVRGTVRATLDKYAPDGGYAWLGGYLGRADEQEEAARINTWINDEVDTYGMKFYKK